MDITRDHVFISYSHKDGRWRDELITHLKPFVRNGSVVGWSDLEIKPGSKWIDEIKAAIEKTAVAVLLVTPDFLASDFIHNHELGEFLKLAVIAGVKILWIPIRASAYAETPLRDYQSLIPPSRPLSQIRYERDETWVKIGKAIRDALSEAHRRAHASSEVGGNESIGSSSSSTGLPTVPISATPKSFRFYLAVKFSDSEQGMRYWTRESDDVFVETYPGSDRAEFRVIGSVSVEGISGTLVERNSNRNFHVFIPDPGKHEMQIKYRFVSDEKGWRVLGVMENFSDQ